MLVSSARCKRYFLASLGTICLVMPAFAGGEVGDFNFNETTGLINIPVARVAPAGSVQLSLGAHAIGGKGTPLGLDVDDLFFGNDGTVRLIAGLPGRVEVSVMGLHGGVFRNNRYIFGAKWLAVPDAPDHPAFAIGVQSLNTGPEPNNPHPTSFDTPSVFGVVSHSFPLNDSGMALDLHAGIGTGRLRNGFAGGEFHVTPEFSVVGETDGTIESAGFRFTPSTRFEILTTAQFQDKVRFGFLLSYRFGPTETEDEIAEELDAVPTDPNAGTTRIVTPEELKSTPPPPPAPEPGSLHDAPEPVSMSPVPVPVAPTRAQGAAPDRTYPVAPVEASTPVEVPAAPVEEAPVALTPVPAAAPVAIPGPRYAPAVGEAITIRPAPTSQSAERVVNQVPNSKMPLRKRDRILQLPMRKRP